MALTTKDLQAIGSLMDTKLEPIVERLDGLETRFDGLEERFDGLEERFDGLEAQFYGLETSHNGLVTIVEDMQEMLTAVKNSQQRVELIEIPKLNALMDGYGLLSTKDKRQDERLDILETKTENHDVRVFSLESEAKARKKKPAS